MVFLSKTATSCTANSVLEPRATDAITGLWSAVRRKDVLSGSVAFASILSKFLPLLLSGIPFKSTQTLGTHQICSWTTVSLLSVMIIFLLACMWFSRWPETPVPPDSLFGAAYYVCDSHTPKDFERLSMLSARGRDRRVKRMARRDRFGWINGVSRQRRIGCDYAEGGQGFGLRSVATVGLGWAEA